MPGFWGFGKGGRRKAFEYLLLAIVALKKTKKCLLRRYFGSLINFKFLLKYDFLMKI